jgi:uncharacterized protein (DUF2249 family)
MDTDAGDSRTTLPLADVSAGAAVSTHDDGTACTCGEENSKRVVLDARLIPHAIRHATIFGALDSLETGASVDLIVGHKPLPLLAQLEQRNPEMFSTEFLIEGTPEWVVRFTRL